jgi:hypothetical protein
MMMLRGGTLALLAVSTLLSLAQAYQHSAPPRQDAKPDQQQLSRRSLVGGFLTTTAAAAVGVLGNNQAAAADTPTESVYFGVGCFWHIQHEFVEAERKLLGRNDRQLTSKAGYAGGKSTGSEGRVCYHNLQGIADYGRLGHGEVVGMDIPTSKIGDFAAVYFSLFNPRTLGTLLVVAHSLCCSLSFCSLCHL